MQRNSNSEEKQPLSFYALIGINVIVNDLNKFINDFLEHKINKYLWRIVLICLLAFWSIKLAIPVLFMYLFIKVNDFAQRLTHLEQVKVSFSRESVIFECNVMFSVLEFKINRKQVTEFLIYQNQDARYCIYVQRKGKNTPELLFTDDCRMLERYFEIVNAIHLELNIVPKGSEGFIDLPIKYVPNRKREYFKIFDQEIEDIRKNGVIEIDGNNFLVEQSDQIDWETGMSSYHFQLDNNTYFFFHPKVVDQLLIIENEIEDLYDLENYLFEEDISKMDKKIEYDGMTFYQSTINKGQYFKGDELVDELITQVTLEDVHKIHHLRIVLINKRIKAYIGKIIEEHQLQEILPEIK